MCNEINENLNVFEKELSPTFLYSWKGVRNRSESSYHSHGHIEMAFVLSGQSSFLINDTLYDITQGDLIIFNPGVKHQALIKAGNSNPSTEFFVGFSDISIREYPENFLPLPNPDSCIFHTSGQLYQKLFKLCASMEAENLSHQQGNYEMMKSYLVQMLLLIIREEYEPVKGHDGYTFRALNRKYIVEQILNYFEDHYSEKISLDQIAENMYLSPFYISKLFKSETGDTPINHLINIRLEKARELLDAGGSIQEVAAAVGYEDAYHFSKLFKKRYGIAPSKTKKEDT